MSISKPIVKWAQDTEHIYLRIDVIPDATDELIVDDNLFTYKSITNNYFVSFELLHDVENEFMLTKTHHYQLVLNKKDGNKEYWVSVNKGFTRSDKSWLRIDWEKWRDENESDPEQPREITFPQHSESSDSSSELSIHSSSGTESDSNISSDSVIEDNKEMQDDGSMPCNEEVSDDEDIPYNEDMTDNKNMSENGDVVDDEDMSDDEDHTAGHSLTTMCNFYL